MGDRFWGLYGEFGVQGMGFGFWTWGGFGGGYGVCLGYGGVIRQVLEVLGDYRADLGYKGMGWIWVSGGPFGGILGQF